MAGVEGLLAVSLKVDDSKLEYVAGMPGGRELILSLVEKGRVIVVPDIEDRFGLSEMLSRQSKDRAYIAKPILKNEMAKVIRKMLGKPNAD